MGISISGDSDWGSYGFDEVDDVSPPDNVGGAEETAVVEEAPPAPAPATQAWQEDSFTGADDTSESSAPMAWSDALSSGETPAACDETLGSFKVPQGVSPDWAPGFEDSGEADGVEASSDTQAADEAEPWSSDWADPAATSTDAEPWSETEAAMDIGGSTEEASGEEKAHGEYEMSPGMKALDIASLSTGPVDVAQRVLAPLAEKLTKASEAAINVAVAAAKAEAEIDAAVRASFAAPGSIMAEDGAVAQAVANAEKEAQALFGDALKLGQKTSQMAESVKSFLENPAVKYGSGGLVGLVGAVSEYNNSTAQTTTGKVVDAALNGAAQTGFALKGGWVGATDATLNLATEYLFGQDGKDVKRGAGGWVSGNLATSIRAVTTLGEAVAMRGENTKGIDEFNQKSLNGDYGLIFKGWSLIGNSEPVRTAGADAIEAVVNGARTVGQVAGAARDAVTQSAQSAAQRGQAALQSFVSRFWH